MTTSSKLKAEFRDLRSAFMKAFANYQKSGMGDKENGDDEKDNQSEEDPAYVFRLTFSTFAVVTCASIIFTAVQPNSGCSSQQW